MDKRTWLSGTMAAGLAALLLMAVPCAHAQDVVGLTAIESADEATIVFELGDGNLLPISLKDGDLLVGAHPTGTYALGGALDRLWSALVRHAGDLTTTELLAQLREFDTAGLEEEDLSAYRVIEGTVSGLAMAAAVYSEIADAYPAVVEVPAPVAVASEPQRIRVSLPTTVAETSSSFVGELAGGLANLLAVYVALAFMGLGLVFFAPKQLETVADTVWHSFWRSFLAGLFAQPLVLPVFVMMIVGLAMTIVGIVVIPFAVSAFLVALLLAIVGGFVAVARSAGEIYLRRRMARGEAVATWGSYRYIVYGLLGLLAIWLPVALLGWIPVAGTVLTVTAAFTTWMIATAGFGAALLSRGGIKGTFVRQLDLALTDEQYWTDEAMPTPTRQRFPRADR